MIQDFFDTKEYRFMDTLRIRLLELHTQNNFEIYKSYLGSCMELSKKKYNNIGWREDQKRYAWDSTDDSDFGVTMICMGDYDDASFYPGHILYFAEDFSKMSLKDDKGNVWKYDEKETDEIKNCSIKDMQKIHRFKIGFEGKLLSGNEKGEYPSYTDKAKAKFTGGKLFF